MDLGRGEIQYITSAALATSNALNERSYLDAKQGRRGIHDTAPITR